MPENAPRDVDEIVDSLVATTREINPAVDMRKGPLAVLMWGFVSELSKTEEFVGYLQILHQFQNADLIDDADLVLLGANYGKDPNTGRATRILCYVYRYSRPEDGRVYLVPAGTAGGTDDGRFIYNSINDAQMDGNFADIYYNSTDQWYEIPILFEAVAVGADYDLPPNTITRLLTALEDFDGIINRDDPKRQGSDPADPIQFIVQLQDYVQGINASNNGYTITLLQEIDPTGYDDVVLVPSTDANIFKRNRSVQGKMGIDVYIISDSVAGTLQEGVAQGGETSILLEKRPVISVEYITVNGIPAAFSFEPDSNAALQGSPRADDRVVLTDPLLPLQSYQISYMYYDFCHEANNAFEGRSTFFETDTLVRLALPVEILIEGEATFNSSADKEEVLFDLRTFSERYMRDPDSVQSTYRRFIFSLNPSDYADSAITNVDGLDRLKLTTFIRTDNAQLPVEIITFDGKKEYPILSANFNIT
jgi:hypothetical protein